MKIEGSMEVRKLHFVNVVKHYLASQKIDYVEKVAATGTVYIEIILKDYDCCPCIRISNHNSAGKCTTLRYDLGKNTSKSRIKERIYRTVDNAIAKAKLSSRTKAFAKVEEGRW